MKVSAISFAQNVNVQPSQRASKTSLPKNYSIISFKSGNPKHIAHIVAEEPLFGLSGGGVGTVSNDYNFLDRDLEKVVKIIPLYNQDVEFEKDSNALAKQKSVKVRTIPNELPEGHPFKGQEGAPFITNQSIDKSTDLVKFLEQKQDNVFVLEEVTSSKIDWGFEKDVPVKMYRAKKDAHLKDIMGKKALSEEQQNKLEFIFTYVDSTASMPKPYADGMSYASSTGDDLVKRFASGWKG